MTGERRKPGAIPPHPPAEVPAVKDGAVDLDKGSEDWTRQLYGLAPIETEEEETER